VGKGHARPEATDQQRTWALDVDGADRPGGVGGARLITGNNRNLPTER